MESYYDEDHERNVAYSTRELAFKIDMTHLKTEEHLAPVIPGGKGRKAPVFEVVYKIIMRYDGLNICFRV